MILLEFVQEDQAMIFQFMSIVPTPLCRNSRIPSPHSFQGLRSLFQEYCFTCRHKRTLDDENPHATQSPGFKQRFGINLSNSITDSHPI